MKKRNRFALRCKFVCDQASLNTPIAIAMHANQGDGAASQCQGAAERQD